MVNLYLLFYGIYATSLVNTALALYGENILGGSHPKEQELNHQVPILGRKNYSNTAHLIGTGGIIGHNLILTAGQIFVHPNGTLKEFAFFIVPDETNLNHKPKIQILIQKIYLPSDFDVLYKDISVAKLATSLLVGNSQRLIALNIPSAPATYVDEHGIITGYGFSSIKLNYFDNENSYRYSGFAANKLKYAYVKIVSEQECSMWYLIDSPETQMCAIVLPKSLGKASGICEKDTGSPLVINNFVVGLATRNQADCDDTVVGCLYTNVSAFLTFIRSIIEGDPLDSTLIYMNRHHIRSSPSCSWNSMFSSWRIAKKKLLIEDKRQVSSSSRVPKQPLPNLLFKNIPLVTNILL